jgi:type III secretion protein W
MSSNIGVPVGDRTAEIIKAFQTEGKESAEEVQNETEVSQAALRQEEEENTSGLAIKSGRLRPPEKIKTERAERAQESVLIRKEEADGLADGFAGREGNRQFHLDREGLSRLLRGLGKEITSDTSADDIIALIRGNLTARGEEPDVAQVDKAFEFILEVLKNKSNNAQNEETKGPFQKLFNQISLAKSQHFEANKQNIETAQKIIDVADILIQQGERGAPETIAHVRDIVNNPQDLSTKFNFYKSKGYTFKEIKHEIDSVLSYVGAKFKTTDILPGEMSRLMDETKTLQAMLQIFRHFKRSMPLAYGLFERRSLDFPSGVNFETLSTTFMKMVDERYPSAEKISQFANFLTDSGLTSEHIKTIMLIILLSLIRDAIREVSPHKVYRSLQHRDDLYLAIIEALEDLEDALEDYEERKKDEEDEEEDEEE